MKTENKCKESNHSAILISRYDPQKEADKYINNILHDRNIHGNSIFIILGAVGDYLVTSIGKRGIPESQIYPCYFQREHIAIRLQNSWCFGESAPLHSFLINNLSIKDLKNIELVEWIPAIKAFPDQSNYVKQQISFFLEQCRSNLHTFGIMGKHWLKNFIRNFVGMQAYHSISSINGNIVLMVPGPSLTQSIPFIIKYRSNLFVAALSSSLKPLLSAGIIPDMVFQTDGGYWASRLFDHENIKDMFLVHTLTSAPVRCFKNVPLLNNCPFEMFIDEKLRSGLQTIPDQGTVTFTALSYLLKISKGNIFICGLDLEYPLSSMHTPHHLQDLIFSCLHDRLHTQFTLSIEFVLSRSQKNKYGNYSDKSINLYASFLSGMNDKYCNRVLRVAPGNIMLPLAEISLSSFISHLKKKEKPYIESHVSVISKSCKEAFLSNLINLPNMSSARSQDLMLWMDTETYLKQNIVDLQQIRNLSIHYSRLGHELLQK